MRIVFLGTGAIGVPSLNALVEGRHEVAAVVTQPDRPAGRNLQLRPSPIKVAAAASRLPILQPRRIRDPDAVNQLDELTADLIVVAAYGQILPRAVLDLPRLGCVNIHASLLPRHRGASPIQAALLAGDERTGITIMAMDEGLDTGDILLQAEAGIPSGATAGDLEARLADLAPATLLHAINLLEDGTVCRQRQDDRLATHAPKIRREDAEINWSLPSTHIERHVRAMSPAPGAFTSLPDGTLLKIHRVEVSDLSGPPGTIAGLSPEGIVAYAGFGAVVLREIQVPGGRRMAAADFVRGRRLATGSLLGG